MSGGGPLVRFEGVTRRFGGIAAVEDVSLDILEGEFFALLGPSGCGKTTLMRMLAGFETPDEGRILLAGEARLGDRGTGALARPRATPRGRFLARLDPQLRARVRSTP